jgi:hypothetical protein
MDPLSGSRERIIIVSVDVMIANVLKVERTGYGILVVPRTGGGKS